MVFELQRRNSQFGHRFIPSVSLAIGMAVFALAHFPWEYETFVFEERQGHASISLISHETENALREGSWVDHAKLRIAGWPIPYYVAIEERNEIPTLVFSGMRLMANTATWVLMICLWLAYERLSKRIKKAGGFKAWNLSLVDLLMFMVFIAGIVSYVTYAISSSSREQQIAKKALGCERVAFAPTFLGPLYPDEIKSLFLHVSSLTLAPNELGELDSVMGLPFLSKIRFVGGLCTGNQLDRLATKPLLRELSITGCVLDAETIRAIAQCDQLAKLTLDNTNINSDGVAALTNLRRLKSLSLSQTDVNLSKIQFGSLSNQLVELILPSPQSESDNALSIVAWPRLRLLKIVPRVNSNVNNAAAARSFTLQVDRSPALESLHLDPFRTFNLSLIDLPRLKSIGVGQRPFAVTIFSNAVEPTTLRIGHFKCSNVPNLKDVRLSPHSLQSISVLYPDALTLHLQCSAVEESHLRSFYPVDFPGYDYAGRQTLIDQLAKCTGIRELHFDRVKLHDLDLRHFHKNPNLITLSLRSAGLDSSSIQQLGSASQLRQLDLEGNALDGDSFAFLLSKIPKLERAAFDIWQLDDVQMIGHRALTSIPSATLLRSQSIPPYRARNVRLVDLPRYRDEVDLSQDVEQFCIEAVPKLRGFSSRRPWPELGVFRGCNDLRYFFGGGEHLNDTVMAAVLKCKDIQQLTIAYSGVSPERLGEVFDLTNLTHVCLAGSRVDDTVVSQWPRPLQLTSLDLDNTMISDSAIRKLTEFTTLESLSLRGCKLTTASLSELTKLRRLTRLRLSDLNIDQAAMTFIIQLKNLSHLELEYCSVNSDALDNLAENATSVLTEVHFGHSRIAAAGLLKLVSKRPEIAVRLGDDSELWESNDETLTRALMRFGPVPMIPMSTIWNHEQIAIGELTRRRNVLQIAAQSGASSLRETPVFSMAPVSPEVYRSKPK
jgi:Leucine-rich repeat (LRR) protein